MSGSRAEWFDLDPKSLRGLAESGPRPLFATVSGAHLYGFPSPDSDVDLRGAFLLSAEDLLGLDPPAETITIEDGRFGGLDWVAHDVRKFARLLTRHNGYVLEQLFSPLLVLSSDAHQELMQLGRGCITRPTARHYLGFANNCRARLRQPDPTVKHLLYAYRVLMTGIHLMSEGEVCANLPQLLDARPVPGVEDLLARKLNEAEKTPLSPRELEQHDGQLDGLVRDLEEARDRSTIPEEPTTRRALDAFVVRLRLEGMGG